MLGNRSLYTTKGIKMLVDDEIMMQMECSASRLACKISASVLLYSTPQSAGERSYGEGNPLSKHNLLLIVHRSVIAQA